MGICEWCGGPVRKGYHHCRSCHREHLRKLGPFSDVGEEEKEIREVDKQLKWLSEKDSGGYLSFNQVCSELHRSRRWLWKVLRATRSDLCSGELSVLLGHPDGRAILSSRYGTLISRNVLDFFRHIRKEEVQVMGKNVCISSRLASEETGYSRRWINHLVKSGILSGFSDLGRVWVDKYKFLEFQEGRQSLPDGSVRHRGISL